MTFNCFKCKAEVVFDNEHIGKNGRKIPLDPDTHQPHDCPMREKQIVTMTTGTSSDDILRVEADKNDHGNETVYDMTPPTLPAQQDPFQKMVQGSLGIKPIDINGEIPIGKKFVDHTAKGTIKLKILTDPTPEGLTQKYNDFPHEIRFSQYQLAPSLYTIAIYYEEVK